MAQWTLTDYAEQHTTTVCEVAEQLFRWAHLNTAQPQMLCGRAEGRLLSMLCQTLGAKCVVEVGAFVGYSTLWLADGVGADGIVNSFEINDEYEGIIRSTFARAGYSERLRLHIGDAVTGIPEWFDTQKPVVDFAFIDAGKRQNRTFYDLLLPRVRRGGMIAIDNVLWGGKVLDIDNCNDLDTRLVRGFNDYVNSDSRVENTMLTIRDGLMLCRVV